MAHAGRRLHHLTAIWRAPHGRSGAVCVRTRPGAGGGGGAKRTADEAGGGNRLLEDLHLNVGYVIFPGVNDWTRATFHAAATLAVLPAGAEKTINAVRACLSGNPGCADGSLHTRRRRRRGRAGSARPSHRARNCTLLSTPTDHCANGCPSGEGEDENLGMRVRCLAEWRPCQHLLVQPNTHAAACARTRRGAARPRASAPPHGPGAPHQPHSLHAPSLPGGAYHRRGARSGRRRGPWSPSRGPHTGFAEEGTRIACALRPVRAPLGAGCGMLPQGSCARIPRMPLMCSSTKRKLVQILFLFFRFFFESFSLRSGGEF
jgi:hypothetical protein